MSTGEAEAPSERELSRLALLAETLPPAAPAAPLRARLIAQLRGSERCLVHAPNVAQRFGLTLEDSQDALRKVADDSAWRPGIWPGSRLLTTPSLMAQSAIIAELPAGFRIPHHRHDLRELTYVLDGELRDDNAVHGSGAFLEKAAGSEHEVAVLEHSPCLVVFSLPRT